MKKFRKWLIHKLGGICKDEIITPKLEVVKREKPIQRLRVQKFYSAFDEIPPKDYIESEFSYEIGKELMPYVKLISSEVAIDAMIFKKYEAIIEVVVND